MLVTDRTRSRFPLVETIDAACSGGVDVVQIREKDLSAADRLALSARIADVARDRASIVVNSDVDTAEYLGVGVHLPDDHRVPPASLRNRLGTDVLLGRSIHAPVVRVPAIFDYLLLGNVFETSSKPGRPPIGLCALTRAVGSTETPLWGIGGIDPTNAASVIRAGATGIAVIGAILDAPDPEAAARALRAAIDDANDHIPVPRMKPHDTSERLS